MILYQNNILMFLFNYTYLVGIVYNITNENLLKSYDLGEYTYLDGNNVYDISEKSKVKFELPSISDASYLKKQAIVISII